jgi:hypothetical protein
VEVTQVHFWQHLSCLVRVSYVLEGFGRVPAWKAQLSSNGTNDEGLRTGLFNHDLVPSWVLHSSAGVFIISSGCIG